MSTTHMKNKICVFFGIMVQEETSGKGRRELKIKFGSVRFKKMTKEVGRYSKWEVQEYTASPSGHELTGTINMSQHDSIYKKRQYYEP